jgi:hypothetical protein
MSADQIGTSDGRQMVVRLRLVIPAALVLALAGCGGGAEASPVPTATVTVTPEAEVVEKTPPSCIKALDLIGQAVGIMGEQMDAALESMYAQRRVDIAGIQAQTERMDGLNEKVEELTEPTRVQVADCRSKR